MDFMIWVEDKAHIEYFSRSMAALITPPQWTNVDIKCTSGPDPLSVMTSNDGKRPII